MNCDIVLARYSEPLEKIVWMINTIRHYTKAYNIHIYDAGHTLPHVIEHARVWQAPNRGQEAGAYFAHLMTHWPGMSPDHQFADLTVFSQADPLPHIDQNISRFFEKLRLLSTEEPVKPFTLLSQVSTVTADGPMVPHIERLFPKSPLVNYGPNPIRDSCQYLGLPDPAGPYDICSGAVFAVSREAILKRPKEFYEKAYGWVGHGPKTHEVAQAERMWPLFFQ